MFWEVKISDAIPAVITPVKPNQLESQKRKNLLLLPAVQW